MVDYRINELSLRLHHRHDDGTWGEFEPRPSHHDPADHDPERGWAEGVIYKCTTCDEEVSVSVEEPPGTSGG